MKINEILSKFLGAVPVTTYILLNSTPIPGESNGQLNKKMASSSHSPYEAGTKSLEQPAVAPCSKQTVSWLRFGLASGL